MGKLSNSVQNLQLHKGRQDSRGSRNETLAKLERMVNNYLMDLYIMNEIVLKREDLARYGLDALIIDLIYCGFSEIVVGENCVTVRYSG